MSNLHESLFSESDSQIYMTEFLSKSAEQVTEALTAATESLNLQTSSASDAVYVDESPAGSDIAGNGSEASPYSSVQGAFIARDSSSIDVLVRKVATAEEPAPSYQPASASAVKKAKKLFEQQQRKNAKAAELAKKQSEEAAAKQDQENKKLEAAKKIVLAEPEGVEKALKIKLGHTVENRGKRVRIFAWVHRLRQQGGLTFVVLRDGTGYLQCVLSGNLVRSHACMEVLC